MPTIPHAFLMQFPLSGRSNGAGEWEAISGSGTKPEYERVGFDGGDRGSSRP